MVTKQGIVRQIWVKAAENCRIFEINRLLDPKRSISQPYVSWCPPPHGWMKLNSDGSVITQNEEAACGGVLRDSEGKFVSAYAVNLGKCNIMQAELWGILHGLQLAWQLGVQQVLVESDSMSAIRLVKYGWPALHPASSLLEEIRRSLSLFTNGNCTHIWREGNFVADQLSKYGHSLPMGVHHFDTPPPCIFNSLFADCNRTLFVREN